MPAAVIVGELGGLRLPIDPPARNDSPFPDPALDVLGAYLKAYITAYAGEAWRKIAPKEPIVRNVFTHDPEDYNFKVSDLPAIYLFPQGSSAATEQLTEDVQIEKDRLRLFWLLPPTNQFAQAERARACRKVAGLIELALRVGRDPSFVIVGDPDPTAAERGSVVLRHAGLSSMKRGEWTKSRIALRTFSAATQDGVERTPYDGVDTSILIEEELKRNRGVDPDHPDLGRFGGNLAYPAELDATVSVDGIPFAQARFPVGYAMLYVQDGATAQTIGTTAAKLTGFTGAGVSSGLEPDAANDRITVAEAGVYDVQAAFSVLGTAGRVAQLRLRKNDVEVAGLGGRAVLAATVGPLAFAPGLVACEANDVLTIYAEADVDATSLTPVDGSLVVTRRH